MKLTRRQAHIVLMIADGLCSNEISENLGLSRLTVDSHRKTILKNSGCRNWCQFMAQVGMSGQLKRWRELHEIRNGVLYGDL